MSASPFFRLSTSSVLTISSFNRECAFRHCGNLGTSHRAANAFVVVKRKRVAVPRARTTLIASTKDPKPSRTTGKSCSPAQVSVIGRGCRRNSA